MLLPFWVFIVGASFLIISLLSTVIFLYVFQLHRLAFVLLWCPCRFPFLLFFPLLYLFSFFICGVEAKASHMLGENSTSDLHLSFYISIFNSTQRFCFYLNYKKICSLNKFIFKMCVCMCV